MLFVVVYGSGVACVRPSEIQNAGDGVFNDGEVALTRGSILLPYTGNILPPGDLRAL